MSRYPVLSASDRSIYPGSGNCPVCGNDLTRGFAYLSAGALLLTPDGQDSLHPDRLQAFLHVGVHGRDPDMDDSADIAVVADLHGGQFDLQSCSITCMRKWLLELLDEIESATRSQGATHSSQKEE
jgi:hypothetical protein